MVGLLLIVLLLGVALFEMEHRPRSPAMIAPVPPPPMVFASPAGGGGPGTPDDAQTDPQNLPYPVEADLAEADPYALSDEKPPIERVATARERFLRLGTTVWK